MEESICFLETSSGIPFGIMGRAEHAPVLFIFALSIQETLENEHYARVGKLLLEDGWNAVSLDAPCHGSDLRKGEPFGLDGWRVRIEDGDLLILDFCRQASEVLDHLIKKGVTDPQRVAACGTSRGGFLAMHFAAFDARVQAVAAFAPVTTLQALKEFEGIKDSSTVLSLDLTRQTQTLAERAVWISIGNDDRRVGTDHAVRLARDIAGAAVAQGLFANIELHVLTYQGHTVLPEAHDAAAAWLQTKV